MKTHSLTWLLVITYMAACSPVAATQPLATSALNSTPILPGTRSQDGSGTLPATTADGQVTQTPTSGKTPFTTDTLQLFQPVREYIATMLQVSTNQISFISSERMEWPDACLGVPEENQVCLQMITPGYLVFFETPNGQVEAHLNNSGRNFKVLGLSVDEGSLPNTEGSGIYGQVLMGHVCAGPVQEGQSCPDQPFQAWITVLDQTQQVVTQFQTDTQGVFRVALPPGEYTLRPESPGKMPYAVEQGVVVQDGQYTLVHITYDSGIR